MLDLDKEVREEFMIGGVALIIFFTIFFSLITDSIAYRQAVNHKHHLEAMQRQIELEKARCKPTSKS